MSATVKKRQVRVVRESTYTGRVVKVVRDGFATVEEAEQFVEAYGKRTGCTMHPWGEPKTVNRVQVV